jgi:penicillin amidase
MLGVDRFIRTLGIYHLAESSFTALSPEAQKILDAYADGVNAWLKTHRHHLPPEFLLLGISPEPWKPADSIVWGKLMALQLSQNYRLEVLRMELSKKLTPAQMNALFPSLGNVPVTIEPRVVKKSGAGDAYSLVSRSHCDTETFGQGCYGPRFAGHTAWSK